MWWKSDLKMYFPQGLWDILRQVEDGDHLTEIRIRVNKPLQLVFGVHERLLDYVADENTCAFLLEIMCDHSVYAHEDELKNCFLTLPKGYRVGLCGKAYCENGNMKRLSAVTGFNVRIARECRGAADDAMRHILSRDGRVASTLVISAPGAGKTTLLRDAARQLASGELGLKVCIADERSEIAGSRLGIPCLDVGQRTDVMDSCPKCVAMSLMLRTMSPDVVITDEIGSYRDAQAIMDAAASGVSVIASAHAGSLAEARKRDIIVKLIDEAYFEAVLLLERSGEVITTKRVL